MSVEDFFSWWFRSRVTGKIVLVQFPNAPLWTYFAGTVMQVLIQWPDSSATAISMVSRAGLALWAVLEIGWGVSPFRRVLGAGVLLAGLAMQVL